MTEANAEATAGKLKGKTRLIATVMVLLAVALDLLDSTIINVAIPTIQHGLGASYSAIQWLIVGYVLSFAVLLITGGRMGDVFGYKKIFMIGVSGFAAMSILCGLAPNVEWLIGFRIAQGAAAALMVPQATSLIQLMYAPKDRGKLMGIFGAIGGLSAALGPIVAGLVLQANVAGTTWRGLFLINIPVALVTLIAGHYLLPKGKSSHPLQIDLVGTGLVVTALTLLILPLIEGPDLHWPTWTIGMIVASLPLFAMFILHQRRKNKQNKSALIESTLFRQPTFVNGLWLNLIFEIVLAGLLLTFTLVLQQGLGYSAIKAALTNLPMIVGIVLGVAVLSEVLVPKIGRYIITMGAGVLTLGICMTVWLLLHFNASIQPWYFSPGLLVTGTGMGMITGPLFAITLQKVDKKHVGSASGVLEAVEQLGGVFGVVIIGSLFFGHVSQGFNQAYVWGAMGTLCFLLIVFAMSFMLPRHFKTEEELDLL